MTPTQKDLDDLLARIPSRVRGVGGAVAVVQDGDIVSRRVWGYADLERQIPMSTSTALPICSISKHMLCLVIADLAREPTAAIKQRPGDVWDQLDAELRKMMPQLFEIGANDGGGNARQLTVPDLFNMQSGIRDYWAMTVLWGARAEDPFSLANDAPKTLDRTKTFHFPPGTEASYSNVNFHILGRLVERVAGHSLGQLLAQRVFIPASMETAALSPNSMGLPLPIVGYEGTEKSGYVPAVNGIEWQGDAGITASLEDMIAYEQYLQRSWKDENSNYREIATPATFNDGSPASYSHGLWHAEAAGHTVLAHTGGLRGFRLQRSHLPQKELSVVVMLNHETDPSAVSKLMLEPILGQAEDKPSPASAPAKGWKGHFFNAEQQRAISVEFGEERNRVMINYGGRAEKMTLTAADSAESEKMKASIDGDTLRLVRRMDGVDIRSQRIQAPLVANMRSSADYAGDYYCAEAESTFTCRSASEQSQPAGETIMYGSFAGFLGKGPMHLMRYVGEDVWTLTCPRSMDAPAPGEWTLVFRRNGDGGGGEAGGVTIGCWLARKNEYVRK